MHQKSGPIRVLPLLTVLLWLAAVPGGLRSGLCADERSPASARLGAGGVGRYTPGRWGLVHGAFTNRDQQQPHEFTAVVMPPDSGGLQFARRMTIPPGVSFETDWPVYMPQTASGAAEMQYLLFEEGKEDRVVREQFGEQLVRSFGTLLGDGRVGQAGLLDDPELPDEDLDWLRTLMQSMRMEEQGEGGLLSLQLDHLPDFAEVFEPLDQLSLTHSGLLERPAVMDSLRLWVQRGGRLVVAVDLTGVDLWNGLFGTTAPMTLVHETSDNDISLALNPRLSPSRYPARLVERTYAEPIRYLRVVTENVEPIWSVNDWPVAVRLPFGEGEVIGLMINARALVEQRSGARQDFPWTVIPSGGMRISELLYKLPEPDMVPADALLAQANDEIGYSIPTRTFALLVVGFFPVVVAAAAWWLYRRERAERLVWAVPLAAFCVAVPPLFMGIQQRNVAPPTVADYRVVRSVPGQNVLAADGTSVFYSPGGGPVSVRSDPALRYAPKAQAGRRETRRLTFQSDGSQVWSDISFPAGLTAIPVQATLTVGDPLSARLSFDDQGITGTVDSGPFGRPEGMLLAGRSPEKMTLTQNANGDLRGGIDRLLTPGVFSSGTLLTERQVRQDEAYRRIFDLGDRTEAFPESTTLLYWADFETEGAGIGDDQTEVRGSVLVVQPVTWDPPPVNEPIVIPAPVVEYRSIPSLSGRFSAAYSNGQRKWVGREAAASLLLEVMIPQVCTPFQPTGVELNLRIRAPERTVRLLAGSRRGRLNEFHVEESPLGMLSLQIPIENLREGLADGRVIVGIDVGEIQLESDSLEDSALVGEQDDSWVIEQFQINFSGKRVSASSGTN